MKFINLFKSLFVILLFSISVLLSAQENSPGDPGGGPGSGDDPIGGGGSAPIGSGMIILGLLGGAYAAGKTYSLYKKKEV